MDAITKQYLNIGCSNTAIDGFVNIGLQPVADMHLDVRDGLPFEDQAVSGIYCEGFLETLDLCEAAALMRECRRVLKPGSRIRFSTRDLDDVIGRYDAARSCGRSRRLSHHRAQTPAEMLNREFRDNGIRWLYNEDELCRIAELAGLRFCERFEPGRSGDVQLSNRETAGPSMMNLEFTRPLYACSGPDPLVSVIIETGDPACFKQVLDSVLQQNYRNLEVIVYGSSQDIAVRSLLQRYSADDSRLRDCSTDAPTDRVEDARRAFRVANGDFIKWISDSELLDPVCIEQMVAVLLENPDVTLTASRGSRSGTDDSPAPDHLDADARFYCDTVVNGAAVGRRLLEQGDFCDADFVAGLFRAEVVDSFLPDIFSFAGFSAEGCEPAALGLNLLSCGNGIVISDILARLPVVENRDQSGRGSPDLESAAQALILHARRLGFFEPAALKFHNTAAEFGVLSKGASAEPVAELSAVISRLADQYPSVAPGVADETETQPVPDPLAEEPPLRIAVYSMDMPDHACAVIRLRGPMGFLDKRVEYRWGVKVDAENRTITADGALAAWADLVIIQRVFPCDDMMPTIEHLLSSETPVIYEADDLLWEIPPSNPVYVPFQKSIPYILSILPRVDLVTVSTEALRNEFLKYNPRVCVLPNLVNPDLWSSRPPAAVTNEVRIGFAGSATHGEDLAIVESALLRIADRFGSSVKFIFMGFVTENLRRLPNLEIVEFEAYEDYPRVLSSLRLDIALAPLVDSRFNRCKSNIKWLEYSLAGVAGIFSDLPPYNSCVEDGETGLLVGNSSDAWYSAIEKLVGDPGWRQTVAESASRRVHERFSLNAVADQYLHVWKGLRDGREVVPEPSPAVEPKLDPLREARQTREYSRWRENQALTGGQAQAMAERMYGVWTSHPSFHLVMLINPGEEPRLGETIDSLGNQFYKGWGLSVVSTAPAPSVFDDAVDQVEWIQDAETPWEALHQTIEETAADWVMIILPGDRLEAHALFSFAEYINLNPDWRFIYSDEDQVDPAGQFIRPDFKPDFNLDLLRSTDYIAHSCMVRREELEALGGFTNLAYVYNQDMALKIFDQFGAAAIGHIGDVLFHASQQARVGPDLQLLQENGRILRYEHLLRCGQKAEVQDSSTGGTYRVEYQHPSTPLVSIIIPTRDRPELISACVDSLLEKTRYPNYEILLVDNGSEVEDVFDYYEKLRLTLGDALTVISYDKPFNFSAMNNLAAEQAKGDMLLLLNNDTEIIHQHWLDNLVNHGLRPEVGVVGARLVYPDFRLQHAGVLIGQNVASHAFLGEMMDDPGLPLAARVDRNYSAVTGACMLVRKALYLEVGGMDQADLAVAYNDVDLCLKIRELGYRNVWTPYSTLIHKDSSSRKSDGRIDEETDRFYRERDTMWQRWLPELGGDPDINRNLSLRDSGLPIEFELCPNWDPAVADKPRILGFPLDGLGCGYYRVYAPMWALEEHARAQIGFVPEHDRLAEPRIPSLEEIQRMAPDALLLQSTLKDNQLEVLQRYKKFSRVFRVFDLDDLKTDVPDSSSRKPYMYKDIKHRLRRGIECCDRLVVSTEPLKLAYEHMIDDILIVPNRLEKKRWLGLDVARNSGDKPRVGWVGAQQHHGDLALLIEVVKATWQEIDWVFAGMCLDELRPYIAEEHPFVSPNEYPAKMASLHLDLAVAPLQQNAFNECKSNLRLLEYGVMGWPVVASDVFPYREGPVIRVSDRSEEWVDAIMDLTGDRDRARSEGTVLRDWVLKHWMLEDHLDEWLGALTP